MDNKEQEQLILEKAKKGARFKRMRPRYPRFLAPILIIALCVLVALWQVSTALPLNFFEAFFKNDDVLEIESLTAPSVEVMSYNTEIKIEEDETSVNGIMITPEKDFAIDGEIENTLTLLAKNVKEKGFNSIYFDIEHKEGYITAIGGKENTAVKDGLEILSKAALDNELRLFVTVNVEKFNLYTAEGLKELESFIIELKKQNGVAGVMLKGISLLKNDLNYKNYLKLGTNMGFTNYLNEVLANNLKGLCAGYKNATQNAYIGIFLNSAYDQDAEKIINKDELEFKKIITNDCFDAVIFEGLGSTNSVAAPFEDMAKQYYEAASSSKTRVGFLLYSTKIAEYANPDQLTRQLMVLEEIGNGLLCFDSFKALEKDTTGAAQTALKYMKGQLSNYKPKGLTFTSPKAMDFTTTSSSIAISGASDPEFSLLADGKEVERTSGGFFSYQQELKVGNNKFKFTHKGSTYTLEVYYKYTVLNSVSPLDNLTLNGGATLVVKANARKGAKVTASLNGQTVSLKEGIDQSTDNTNKESEFTLFEGSITLPQATNKEQNLGKITFKASFNGVTDTKYSGTIKVNRKPEETPIYSPITHEGVKPGNKLIAEVIASYVETFDGGSSTDDYSRPTNSYLPKGTIDYVNKTDIYDASSRQTYIRLGYDKRVYSKSGSVKISKGLLPESNAIGVKSTTTGDQYTTIVLDMAFPFSHNIDIKPQKYTNAVTQDYTISSATYTYVEVYLPYTNSISGNVELGGNKLFGKAEFAKSGSGYILKLHLKEKGKFYGYTSYFDSDGNLILKFLNPKKTVGNNLSGVRICIDAGHGGDDPGTVAYDNRGNLIKESERCLTLAKKVQTKLQSLGATVIMTRTAETSLEPADRTAKIRNSNAHLTVSFHRNSAGNANARGFTAYHFNAYTKSPAEYIYNAMKAKNLPNYTNTAWSRVDWHWFGYSRVSNMPVVLTENGFMSNAGDLQNIISDDFNDKCAEAVVEGIVKYFNNQ